MVQKVEKWKVYIQITQLKELGFSNSKIAKKLGIARGTVIRYLHMNPEEMAVWLASTRSRARKLDPYQKKILNWLKEHPDLSSAQIADWLDEKYPEFQVGESTVRRYVREIRKEFNIPKTTYEREYEAVPDLPMGLQVQVDFGERWQKNEHGQSIKIYVVAFVLSHSRYKYMEWLDRPFTTKDLIQAHKNAFHAFGGKPEEMVYDQDNIIIVSENNGDIIYTEKFEAFRRAESFQIYACRGNDPESKGKIENVIGFIKNNFAKHRVYTTLDDWNEQGKRWLERRGNGKTHNTTKKKPVEVFQIEKQYLRPVQQLISVPTNDKLIYSTDTIITRVVRKDNTILYKANRYSVPLGTYSEFGKEVHIHIQDTSLYISDPDTNEVIGEHSLSEERGILIQNRSHTRDRTQGIQAYKDSIANKFDDPAKAHRYLDEIQKRYPRYIRDQLQLIKKLWDSYLPEQMSEGLDRCTKQNLFSATEYRDMMKYLVSLQPQDQVKTTQPKEIQPVHSEASYLLNIKPPVRDIGPYMEIMEGGDPS